MVKGERGGWKGGVDEAKLTVHNVQRWPNFPTLLVHLMAD